MVQLRSEKPQVQPRKSLGSRVIQRQALTAAKHAAANNPVKRRQRWRPGTVALREVRRYQNTTDFLIKRAPFRRFLREVVSNLKESFRMSVTSLEAIQEAAETYVTSVLNDANLCTLHANRVTLFPKDIHLALKLRGERQ